MNWRYGATASVVGASLVVVVGCNDGDPMPTGPMENAGFMSISPRGGATGVPIGTSVQLHWSEGMGAGMEQYVDLHMGALSGPTLPMSYDWTADRRTLLCTPLSPLRPGTQYVVHVGGGMVGVNSEVVDMMQYGPGYGGQWIQGGMMGSGHDGMSWGAMGGNWRHSNGSYGMAFFFTTE